MERIVKATELTLLASILQELGNPSYFQLAIDNGSLVLTPANPEDADSIREDVERIGITGEEVDEAIQWARRV